MDLSTTDMEKGIQILTPRTGLTLGKIYSIVGESNTKQSWKILNDNKSKKSILKTSEGVDFQRVSVSNQGNGLENEKDILNIQILSPIKGFTEGNIYSVVGE